MRVPVYQFRFLFAALLTAWLVSGCASTRRSRSPNVRHIPPVVAVASFENRANFHGKWNLGDGMAELMIDELVDTGRVTVLERRYLGDVIGEIVRQGQDLFRKEGRVERGRLKNTRYYIRGVVSDFTVTGDASGWFGTVQGKGWLRGSTARVALAVYVTDVETGQIISSVKTEGTARQGAFGAAVDYADFAFGGDAFFRTPLGSATRRAMERAVRDVLAEIPIQPWEARVAEAGPDSVILNGGANVGIVVGDLFVVRREGRSVTDPVTGNVIDMVPGRITGTVRIDTVQPTAAYGSLVEGEARRGDLVESAP